MTLSICGETWTVDQAAAVCLWYEERFSETLALYDFAGDESVPHAHDSITLADAGRLVVINARLEAADVPTMIRRGADAPWDAVPQTADLLAVEDVNGLLNGAETLYRHFRRNNGLGPTRTHKLLHLKRPAVFPVVDSVVRAAYRTRAASVGRELGSSEPHYWMTLAQEMRENTDDYGALHRRLGSARTARLTVPRLHDILVWSLHNTRDTGGRRAAMQRGAPSP